MKKFIDKIIKEEITDFSDNFYKDFCSDRGKKRFNIPNKQNNLFISALGDEIAMQSALMRSLDSSLGNRIEKIAKRIAEANFIVKKNFDGRIPLESARRIADLLNEYENKRKPKTKDVLGLVTSSSKKEKKVTKTTDYFLTRLKDKKDKYLLELKSGGDLDNKKAKSEKESLLKQYLILRGSGLVSPRDKISLFYCTAYNKDGEGKPWKQERVKQYFADEEIKIGKDFWNFISASKMGYVFVKNSYVKHSPHLKSALKKIVEHYS